MSVQPKEVLAPGQTVVVEVPLALAPRYYSVLRGQRVGRYLILDNRLPSGRSVPLEGGMAAVVRLIHQGEAYGFECQVISRISYPDYLAFFTYPDSLANLPVLRGKRYPVFLDAVLAAEPVKGDWQGRRVDLILGLTEEGCLLESEATVAVNLAGFLSFRLPGGELLADLPARVRSCAPQGAGHQVVIEFGDLPPAARKALAAFLGRLDAQQVDHALGRVACLAGSGAPCLEPRVGDHREEAPAAPPIAGELEINGGQGPAPSPSPAADEARATAGQPGETAAGHGPGGPPPPPTEPPVGRADASLGQADAKPRPPAAPDQRGACHRSRRRP